jgi:hypothetical protein
MLHKRPGPGASLAPRLVTLICAMICAIKIMTFDAGILSPQRAYKLTNAEISPSNYSYFFLDVPE